MRIEPSVVTERFLKEGGRVLAIWSAGKNLNRKLSENSSIEVATGSRSTTEAMVESERLSMEHHNVVGVVLSLLSGS